MTSPQTKCVIDDDPFADNIARLLRQEATATNVNAHLRSLDPTHVGYTPTMISRHRTGCLGMVKLAKGRIPKKTLDQKASDVEKASSVSNDEILRISKAAFYDRVKRTPGDVTTRELVSVISALAKGGAGNTDPMDALTSAMGDLSDEEASSTGS